MFQKITPTLSAEATPGAPSAGRWEVAEEVAVGLQVAEVGLQVAEVALQNKSSRDKHTPLALGMGPPGSTAHRRCTPGRPRFLLQRSTKPSPGRPRVLLQVLLALEASAAWRAACLQGVELQNKKRLQICRRLEQKKATDYKWFIY